MPRSGFEDNSAVGKFTKARGVSRRGYAGLQSHLAPVGDGEVLLLCGCAAAEQQARTAGLGKAARGRRQSSKFVTNVLQKLSELQEHGKEAVLHGAHRYKMMFLASLDVEPGEADGSAWLDYCGALGGHEGHGVESKLRVLPREIQNSRFIRPRSV